MCVFAVRNCLTMKGFTPIEDDPVSLRSPLIWMDSGVVMTTVMVFCHTVTLNIWSIILIHKSVWSLGKRSITFLEWVKSVEKIRWPEIWIECVENFQNTSTSIPRLGGHRQSKHTRLLNSARLLINDIIRRWSIRDFYDHHQRKPGGIYIAKPVASSQGRGIFLFKNPEDPAICDLLDPRNYNQIIIQQYLSDPFLIDRTKFDFRIYVLVTSADPLEAMIYREGLGRFATCRYEAPKSNNSGNVFMHLTNYSINKLNAEFDRDQGNGSKRFVFHFRELRNTKTILLSCQHIV